MADARLDPCVHRRPRRLAARGGDRSRAASGGADRDRRRSLLRDGPRQPRRAHRAGRSPRSSTATGVTADDPVAAVARELRRRRDRRVHRAGRLRRPPAPRAGTDAAIFFNFRPDRGRQLSRRLLERGVDLTTMTRYAEDIDDPGRLPRAGGRRHARRDPERGRARGSCTPPRPRSTRTSRTSSTAARSRSGRERRACSCPSPRDVAELRREARDVGRGRRRRGRRARFRTATAFCVVNFANPDMVGHTGVIPAVVAAVEAADAALGRVVAATLARGGVCLVTADHGNAEKMLEADGVSPHTAHTTNPVPLVSHRRGRRPARGRRPRGSCADGARTARLALSRRR